MTSQGNHKPKDFMSQIKSLVKATTKPTRIIVWLDSIPKIWIWNIKINIDVNINISISAKININKASFYWVDVFNNQSYINQGKAMMIRWK